MGENNPKTDIPSPLSEARDECSKLKAQLEIADTKVAELREVRSALIMVAANLSAVLSRPPP